MPCMPILDHLSEIFPQTEGQNINTAETFVLIWSLQALVFSALQSVRKAGNDTIGVVTEAFKNKMAALRRRNFASWLSFSVFFLCHTCRRR